jgi:hypothetical protein
MPDVVNAPDVTPEPVQAAPAVEATDTVAPAKPLKKVRKVRKAKEKADGAEGSTEPAKREKVEGYVLKVVFRDLNAEGLKVLRRYLRQAWRAQGPYEGKPGQFSFHKKNNRWIFPSKEDVRIAKGIRKGIGALNGDGASKFMHAEPVKVAA